MSTPAQLRAIEPDTSLVVQDVEQEHDTFLNGKPSNRGKFSHDRDTWDRIHEQRYIQWQLGDSIESIAADHQVTYNAVKNSIHRCEVRLRPAEVLAGRCMRVRMTAISSLQDQYLIELKKLMADENALIRLKALEHFRRTVGMENVGIQVNQLNVQASLAAGASYEERIRKIREAQLLSDEPNTIQLETGRGLVLLPGTALESE